MAEPTSSRIHGGRLELSGPSAESFDTRGSHVAGLDASAMWPDLFIELDDRHRANVRDVFATEYLTGWEPDRAAVADVIELASGRIGLGEYMNRSAARMASVPPST